MKLVLKLGSRVAVGLRLRVEIRVDFGVVFKLNFNPNPTLPPNKATSDPLLHIRRKYIKTTLVYTPTKHLTHSEVGNAQWMV